MSYNRELALRSIQGIFPSTNGRPLFETDRGEIITLTMPIDIRDLYHQKLEISREPSSDGIYQARIPDYHSNPVIRVLMNNQRLLNTD